MKTKKHACEVCNKRFMKPHEVTNHMVTHTGLKPYQCNICHKMYAHRQSLNRHYDMIHCISYDCYTCGKPHMSRRALNVHVQNTHQQRLYDCPICDPPKYFITRTHFKKHLDRHMCSGCCQWFPSKELKKHMLICHPSGLFHCDICNNSYVSKIGLKKHFHKIHYASENCEELPIPYHSLVGTEQIEDLMEIIDPSIFEHPMPELDHVEEEVMTDADPSAPPNSPVLLSL